MTGVIVQPQDVAIPIGTTGVNSEGRPVVSFYVQLGIDAFVSSAVVTMAIQVGNCSKVGRLVWLWLSSHPFAGINDSTIQHYLAPGVHNRKKIVLSCRITSRKYVQKVT
jgi:hypothetical protein